MTRCTGNSGDDDRYVNSQCKSTATRFYIKNPVADAVFKLRLALCSKHDYYCNASSAFISVDENEYEMDEITHETV